MAAINAAAADWGIVCKRYEIRDIAPPPAVRAAMEMQAEAERRKKRALRFGTPLSSRLPLPAPDIECVVEQPSTIIAKGRRR